MGVSGSITKALLTLSVLLLVTVAFSCERETIRDTHDTDRNSHDRRKQDRIRDVSGKVTGTATTNGNMTTYRGVTAKTVGIASESGNKTTYRDVTGNKNVLSITETEKNTKKKGGNACKKTLAGVLLYWNDVL